MCLFWFVKCFFVFLKYFSNGHFFIFADTGGGERVGVVALYTPPRRCRVSSIYNGIILYIACRRLSVLGIPLANCTKRAAVVRLMLQKYIFIRFGIDLSKTNTYNKGKQGTNTNTKQTGGYKTMRQFIKVNIFNLIGIAITGAAFVYLATHFNDACAAFTILFRL